MAADASAPSGRAGPLHRLAAALMALGADRLEPELVDETLGVVLKVEEDVRLVRGTTARGYLDEMVARG